MSASMFGGRTATENYVWNTGTLEWDRMTQPGGGGAAENGKNSGKGGNGAGGFIIAITYL